MSKKSFYGIGYNSRGRHKTSVNGTHTAAYSTWREMIRRCYCPKLHARHPTYIGCSVANEWRDLQDFGDWYYSHPYRELGYELDKDLIFPNNKIYSPDTCCFVPQELNKLLLSHASARGDLPQGIYWDTHTKKYKAQLRINGKQQHLGRFETEQEAYQAYKTAKEANVKRMALEWKDRIASDVFDALMRWSLDS